MFHHPAIFNGMKAPIKALSVPCRSPPTKDLQCQSKPTRSTNNTFPWKKLIKCTLKHFVHVHQNLDTWRPFGLHSGVTPLNMAGKSWTKWRDIARKMLYKWKFYSWENHIANGRFSSKPCLTIPEYNEVCIYNMYIYNKCAYIYYTIYYIYIIIYI